MVSLCDEWHISSELEDFKGFGCLATLTFHLFYQQAFLPGPLKSKSTNRKPVLPLL